MPGPLRLEDLSMQVYFVKKPRLALVIQDWHPELQMAGNTREDGTCSSHGL